MKCQSVIITCGIVLLLGRAPLAAQELPVGEGYLGNTLPTYPGGISGGYNEQLYPYDNQEPWLHGQWQEIPPYGGFVSFRPYNYKHVFSQAQTAAGWGERANMPYSQQFWHRYADRARMERIAPREGVKPSAPAQLGPAPSYGSPYGPAAQPPATGLPNYGTPGQSAPNWPAQPTPANPNPYQPSPYSPYGNPAPPAPGQASPPAPGPAAGGSQNYRSASLRLQPAADPRTVQQVQFLREQLRTLESQMARELEQSMRTDREPAVRFPQNAAPLR